MKTCWKHTLTVLASLLICMSLPAQDNMEALSGNWKGVFWEEFETILVFDVTDADFPKGRIEMFDSQSQIQDDPLSKIRLVDRTLTFYIPAKETDFEGTLDETNSEISGKFIFPDGSEHPFSARKPADQ
jgi:hypothetical protein